MQGKVEEWVSSFVSGLLNWSSVLSVLSDFKRERETAQQRTRARQSKEKEPKRERHTHIESTKECAMIKECISKRKASWNRTLEGPLTCQKSSPILIDVTRWPHALRRTPMLEAVTPFPRPLTTPPVTKTYFIFVYAPLRRIGISFLKLWKFEFLMYKDGYCTDRALDAFRFFYIILLSLIRKNSV